MNRSPPTPSWKLPHPPTNETDPPHQGEKRKPWKKRKSAWREGRPPPPNQWVVHEGSEKGRFVDKSMDFLIRRKSARQNPEAPLPQRSDKLRAIQETLVKRPPNWAGRYARATPPWKPPHPPSNQTDPPRHGENQGASHIEFARSCPQDGHPDKLPAT